MKKIFLFVIFILFTGFNQSAVFSAPLNGDYPLAQGISAAEARRRVIEAGKKYLGTPYVYAGITSKGVDCSGFVYASFKDALGVTLPRATTALHAWAEEIPINTAQPGDLLFFRTGSTRDITHVGLYIGDRRFIHAASAGSKTGVIYSSLDEQYYTSTYASAGRALPPASSNAIAASGRQPGAGRTNRSAEGVRFLVGAAAAPNWDFFQISGNVLRGFASQIIFCAEFAPALSFALELRPEYDDALGVFRLPLTLSWGPNDIVRFFIGPALSYGSASFTVNNEYNNYSGGTSWFGSAGVTLTPFTIKASKSEFAPYAEAAFQMYKNDRPSTFPDILACTRLSTGLRWRMAL